MHRRQTFLFYWNGRSLSLSSKKTCVSWFEAEPRFFHKLGEDLVLASEFGFELFDFAFFGVFGCLGFAAVLESEMALLEETLEPVVNLGGLDVEFIAKVRNRNLVDEMPFEDGDLFGAFKMATLLGIACS